MKLVLATSNKGKVREIKAMCEDYEVVAYSELIDEFEIIEDGETFKENALIKARAVFKVLRDEDVIVLADEGDFIFLSNIFFTPKLTSKDFAGIR